ncbi:MAG: hypothetical protein V4640_01120 [Verrucomicrobiota bacterium]
MSSGKSNHVRHPGHVNGAALAIGSLSMLLVAGMALPGIVDRLDGMVARMTAEGAAGFPKSLPTWCVWLFTLFVSYAVPFAILGAPGTWRRVMLWLTALVLVAGWAPVLVLAAHAPDVAAPWIATLWSGVCALVYAKNHRMPVDVHFRTPSVMPR